MLHNYSRRIIARMITVKGTRHPYSRLVVPPDVRAALGRTEWKEPRREATHAERVAAHGAALAHWKATIAHARAVASGQAPSRPKPVVRVAVGDPVRLHDLGDWHTPGTVAAVDADGVLVDFGRGYQRTYPAEAFGESYAEMARALVLRPGKAGTGGAAIPVPAPSLTAEPLPFGTLLERWQRHMGAAPRTVDQWKGALVSLRQHVGHDDARLITKQDARAWVAARQEAGTSATTIANRLVGLQGIWTWGMEAEELLRGPNPFAKLAPRAPRRAEATRVGYDDAEARTILLAARAEAGALRWLPWLLAFTGARISEIADLRARDVRQDGGTWIMDVVPLPYRRLKNGGSQRMLPIHPAIVAEGFLDYAAALPPAGPLFPDVAADKTGARLGNVQEAHQRWMRGPLGIKDKRKAPAHSWRHRIEDECRKVRMPTEAQDALTGHKNPRNAGAGYGRGWRGMPAELLEEVARISSPLDLPLPKPM